MAKGTEIRNVSTTRGVKGGSAFSAPEGTPLPTDYATPIDPAFACLGFVSEDGFTESVDGSGDVIKDLNGDTVDTYSEGKTETIGLKLIEMSEEALGMQYGHKNVEKRDGMIVVKHDWSNAEESRPIILELLLKNGRRWRKVIPSGKVSELGEFTGSSTEVAGREVTVTYSTDKDGGGCYDYIQDIDTASESGPSGNAGSGTDKSIDEMTKDELIAYANEHSIDITGKTLKEDILAAIKAAEAAE